MMTTVPHAKEKRRQKRLILFIHVYQLFFCACHQLCSALLYRPRCMKEFDPLLSPPIDCEE